MKFNHLIFFVSFSVIIGACNNKPSTENRPETDNTVSINTNELTQNKSAIKVADSIMYIANVKNPDSEAYYMKDWLGGAKIQILADKIFNAVYDKRLKAYNYITGEKMSIEDIKNLENEFSRDDIGQILFTEDWYFDEKELKMYKQVNSIMLAYFRYDEDGNLLGNKSGIRVYLNGTKPMRGAQDY